MPKKFEEKKVVSCYESMDGSGIYYLKLLWNGDMPRPGQFIMLAPAQGSGMKRPFAVYMVCNEIGNNTLTIAFNIVGGNTKLYSKLKTGDKIKAAGPLGKPFVFDDEYNNYIVVSGGMGFAPLSFLASGLNERKKTMKVLLGAQRPEQLNASGFMSYVKPFKCQIKTITKKGQGITGLVTDLLKQELELDNGKSIVVTCGPVLMEKEVARLCKAKGNKCLVFLEEMMACGIGSCKSCAVFLKNKKTKHVCSDGPIFDAEEIDWEKLAPAKTQISLPQSKITDQPMKTVLVGQQGKELALDYPLMNASGCLDVEAIESEQYDTTYIGMLVSKGITLLPKVGNPAPRVCETPCGMLNSIGLENPGVDVFIKEKLPRWLAFGKPLAVNISGSSPEEYAELAGRLFNAGIKIVEVNVSCPNLLKKIIGKFSEDTFEVVRAIYQAAPNLFIIVKLPPMSSDIVAVAQAAYEAGADAISAINTIEGMDIDINTRRSKLGGVYGGLSGPAILPAGLKIVNLLHNAKLGIPILGVGGITDAEGAIKYFIAGAQAVQFGTGGFANPNIATEICLDVLKYMEKNNINHIQNLVGSLIVN